MTRVDEPQRAKKSLGQNFLIDPNYIRKIVTVADPEPEDTIVEIGPGRGAITSELVASGAEVIAIELDSDLAQRLERTYAETNNFRMIEADATEIDFAVLLEGKRAKVVANLPYYISTAILQHLAVYREHFNSLTLMFQKEVVGRITASPKNSERGFLTVLVESAFTVERLFDVPPAAFQPVPKVTSTVVRLIPKPDRINNEAAFRELIGCAFAHKRKTILNNLKARYPDAKEKLERSGIDSRRRAESLTLDEWSRLHGGLEESV